MELRRPAGAAKQSARCMSGYYKRQRQGLITPFCKSGGRASFKPAVECDVENQAEVAELTDDQCCELTDLLMSFRRKALPEDERRERGLAYIRARAEENAEKAKQKAA